MEYAYAKFTKTCVRHKNLSVVKNFTGDEVNRKKIVRITCGEGYCTAILLFVGGTEESVKAFLLSTSDKKRVKFPNYTAVDSPSSDTETEYEKKQTVKRKADENGANRQNILQSKLAKLHSIGDKSISTTKPARQVTKPETSGPMENEIRTTFLETPKTVVSGVLCESNVTEKTNNQKEGTVTCNKDTPFNENQVQTAADDVNLKLKLKEKEKLIKKLLQENAQLKTQLRDEIDQKNDLFSLNCELQRKVIGDFSNLQLNLKDLRKEATEAANASGKECPDRVGAIKGEEIHLGRDIWIKKGIYNAIAGRSKMTLFLFVKEMAVAVFVIEELRVSTLTGTVSNRTKKINPGAPRPSKLNPMKVMAIRDITYFWIKNHLKKDDNFAEIEKAKVTNYISHKKSELKKKEQNINEVIENADKEKDRVLQEDLNQKDAEELQSIGTPSIVEDDTNDSINNGNSRQDFDFVDPLDLGENEFFNNDEDVEDFSDAE